MLKFKPGLLTTSALLPGLAIIGAQPAHAISTTNLTVISATSNGAQCNVNFSFVATFTLKMPSSFGCFTPRVQSCAPG